MSKTILVTGGAGYIGSHTIVELLETTDFKVISIDNLSNSSEKTYSRIKEITGKEITHYAIDLCDRNETEKIFATNKIDGIIHFAAFKSVPESVTNPHKYYHNNINSLLNLLELSVKFNIHNFIFSSSCSVYGDINTSPVSEETQLNKAVSPYAYTKQIGEQILEDYSKIYTSIQFIALRYFNPVGAHPSALIGEDPINPPTSLTPILTKTAIGLIKEMYVHGTDFNTPDGSCIRDYVHVCDIANAHILALKYLMEQQDRSRFEIINLGTGKGVSVLQAIHCFEKVNHLKLNYKIGARREGDVASIFSDNSKSKKILNWEPRLSLDQMMKSAWEWEKKCFTNKITT